MIEVVPPNQEKVAALREQGIVPCSRFTVRAISAAAVLMLCVLSSSKLQIIVEQLCSQNAALSESRESLLMLGRMVLTGWVFLGCVILVAVAAQTKLLLRLGALAPDLSRILGGRCGGLGGVFARIARLAMSTVVMACAAILLWRTGISQILLLLGGTTEDRSLWLSRLMPVVAPYLIALLAVSAVLGWLLARLRFVLQHRMTEKELALERRAGR